MLMRLVGVVSGAIAICLVTVAAASSPSRQSRAQAALDSSITQYTQWFGPAPAGGTFTGADTVWLSAPLSMDVEAEVAYRAALQWWRWPVNDAGAAHFFGGLSWYLQGRVVERLFDLTHARPGHSVVGARLFGGNVPWVFSILPVDRSAADDWLLRSSATPIWSRRLPSTLAPDVARGAIAFATLERFIGWPALQGALRVLAEQTAQAPVTREQAVAILTAAAGQDVSGFLSAAPIDFSVGAVVSETVAAPCPPSGCVRTRVTVHRVGASLRLAFADVVELRVVFADGQSALAHWDGSADSETLEFASNSEASSIDLDPRRLMRLDVNPLNNRVVLTGHHAPLAAKWLASWAVWLQDASLMYGFLF